MDIFFDVQRGLPRQGPGLDTTTLEALTRCSDLPDEVAVLDIGCGPGAQTLALAQAINGHITAIDLYQEYLDQLAERAAAASLADSITVSQQDMTDLPYPEASFNLLWAEASAYVLGFQQALTQWKPLLKPGGYIMLSDLVWLTNDPPQEVSRFWAQEYPDMHSVQERIASIAEAGYQFIDYVILPDEGWWQHYYTPLNDKLSGLVEKYTGDVEALGIIESTRIEIEMRRRHPTQYGYVYFIGRAN